MSEGFFGSEDKKSIGAIAIASFAIFASAVVPEDVVFAWTIITISCVYFAATRRITKELSVEGLISTLPITLLASVMSVSGGYSLASLVGHPIEGEAVEMVQLVVQLCFVSWVGVFLWYMAGNIGQDYFRTSERAWITRYIFSPEKAFLIGDIVCTMFVGYLYLVLKGS